MKTKLFVSLLLSSAFAFQAVAEPKAITQSREQLDEWNQKLQALCGQDKVVDHENAQAESNKIWKEILKQIQTAKIKLSTSEDFSLTDRTTLHLGGSLGSEPSIGGKYSGIDRWKVGLSQIIPLTDQFNVGASATREVVYIQQFPNRCKSLSRVPYDPVTRLPISSERALDLNPGDFVAFSAPLVVSLGADITKYLNATDSITNAGFGLGASVYAAGEINIHVYRMPDNYVRVRFFTSKSKGVLFSGRMTLPGVGGILASIIDATPLQIDFAKVTSNLFTADFVFNLNNAESKELYDKTMKPQYTLKSHPVMSVSPFRDEDAIKNILLTDISGIEKIVSEDKTLTNDRQKRVLRIAMGDNKTVSERVTTRLNLLKLIKFKIETVKDNSSVSIVDAADKENFFHIRSNRRLSNWSVASVWGQEDSHITGFLFNANRSANGVITPTSPLGLQTNRIKEELSFSMSEIKALANRLEKTLPDRISAKIKLPVVTKDLTNARIEQQIFFNAEEIAKIPNMNFQRIQNVLIGIIKNWGRLSAKPFGTESTTDLDSPAGQRLNKLQGAEGYWVSHAKGWTKSPSDQVVKMYLNDIYDQEIQSIPTHMETLLQVNATVLAKIDAYEKLQEIPLFVEIGAALMLKLVENEPNLAELVNYRLEISGRGLPSASVSEYPDAGGRSTRNTYERVLNENSFLGDRTYNLRYYMNEKGESLNLEEVLAQSKFK